MNLQHATTAAVLSAAAYHHEHAARTVAMAYGFKTFAWMDQGNTQALVASNETDTFIAFRGTTITCVNDILADAKAHLVGGPFFGSDRVHAGFREYVNAVWADVMEHAVWAREQGRRLHFAGHSLGGAAAVIASAFLAATQGIKADGVFTFGMPRPGNREFRAVYDFTMRGRVFSFVNNNDVVPRLPPWLFGYRTVGTHWHISRDGELWERPGFWRVFWDRWAGRTRGLFKWGTDGIRDHDMATYLHHLNQQQTGTNHAD